MKAIQASRKLIPKLELPIVHFSNYENDYQIIHERDTQKLFSAKTLLIGIPGAFIPSITHKLIPEYVFYNDEVRVLGKFEQIYVMSVNDPYVLKEFAEEIDAEEKLVYISDYNAELTKALNTELQLNFCGNRSRAFRAIVQNSEILSLSSEESWQVTKASRVFRLMTEISPYPIALDGQYEY